MVNTNPISAWETGFLTTKTRFPKQNKGVGSEPLIHASKLSPRW
jgi:hypothetical protein